jgi:phage I-like protein
MSKQVIRNAVTTALPEMGDGKAEAGKPLVIQLAPHGEYPQFVDDDNAEGGQRKVVQILDDDAMDALISNFKDKVLVDADHSSEISTDTKAMAWVTRLFKDPEKGLMAEIEPTTIGADTINGKVYRFVSGAWTLDDAGRPQELVSIGLTNKPNLPVAPMLNSAAAGDKPKETPEAGTVDDATSSGVTPEGADDKGDAAPVATNGGADGAGQPESTAVPSNDNNQPENTEGLTMDKVKELLGLPAEATDEEVFQAIEALKGDSEFAENVRNALNMDDEEVAGAAEGETLNEKALDALNAVLNQCGDLQAQNAEMEEAKLNAEADELIAENEDVIPEDMVEEVKAEYVEDPEAARETVANFRKVHNFAVLNASRGAEKKDEPKKPVAINWRSAKKPVAVNAGVFSSGECDPEKENEAIRNSCVKR